MRLAEAFQLLEGVKFTTAQIEQVKRMSNDILVGIEYEYHVNPDVYAQYQNQSNIKDVPVYAIQQLLSDNNKWHVNPQHISKIISEMLVPPGVEVITKPLPLNQAIQTMEDMFAHIRDVGSTSDATGLHTNISLKRDTFDESSFNPIKLVMLMDDREILDRYPVRLYVDSVVAKFTDNFGDEITKLAELMVDKHQSLGNAIMNSIGKNIDKFEKFQGLNFKHMFDGQTKVYERRVEFRYIGGDDYEDRFNEIARDIYKQSYMLLAAFDPDFLEKEYLKNILRLLDDLVKTATIKVNGNVIPPQDSFLDYRKTVQHYGEGFNFQMFWKQEFRI